MIVKMLSSLENLETAIQTRIDKACDRGGYNEEDALFFAQLIGNLAQLNFVTKTVMISGIKANGYDDQISRILELFIVYAERDIADPEAKEKTIALCGQMRRGWEELMGRA